MHLDVTADHVRVLRKPSFDFVVGVKLDTHVGTRRYALGDRPITLTEEGQSRTYVRAHGMDIVQSGAFEGIGTARFTLSAPVSLYGSLFTDTAQNKRVKNARLRYQIILWDDDNSVYLSPLTVFTGRGLQGSDDDQRVQVEFTDLFGYQPAELRWILSRYEQRRINTGDTSMDGLNKQPPQRSGSIG